ncbi:MAG: M48 family metalloprotease [Chlamydiota bacterium]
MSIASIPADSQSTLFNCGQTAEKKRGKCTIKEWYLDVKYPVTELFLETLFMPIMRLPRIVKVIFELARSEGSAKGKGIAITAESIASGKIFGAKESKKYEIPSRGRLYLVLDRVQELAKKMGINKEVHLYRSMGTSAHGLSFFSNPAQLFIEKKHLLLPDDELDFILCHELSHIKHNDRLKTVVFDAIACLVEVVAFPLIFPIAVLIIEPAINLCDHYVFRRNKEESADQNAIQTLQSNTGAVNHWKRTIKENLDKRASAVKMLEVLAKLKSKGENVEKVAPQLLKMLKERLDRITLSGDTRNDFDHPPLTKRLANALAFKPRSFRACR